MEGCGFSGVDAHFDIIGCLQCHIIYSKKGGVNCNHNKPAYCKKCRGKAIRYEDQYEDIKHICPQCGENTLAFYHTGNWD